MASIPFPRTNIDPDVIHDCGKLEAFNKAPYLRGQNKAKRKNWEKGVKDTVFSGSAVWSLAARWIVYKKQWEKQKLFILEVNLESCVSLYYYTDSYDAHRYAGHGMKLFKKLT